MTSFLIAITFLTIFPYKKKEKISEVELGRSAAFFPLVGLSMGIVLLLINLILSFFFPKPIIIVFLLLALIIMSRGLHLDGLADFIDSFGGGYTQEERLKVMKDSSIGVFGVCGIVFIILLKFISLNSLSNEITIASLLIMPMGGRLSIVFTCFVSQPVKNNLSLGKPFIENVGEREFWIAMAIGGISSLFFMGKHGVLIIVALLTFSIFFERYVRRHIGGTNGDTLGAVSEISELIVLLLALIFDSNVVLPFFKGI